MNATNSAPYWDPYDPALIANPYPALKRLREEAPLYYNAPYDFYAVSRFDDVEKGMFDRETYISGRGGILEFIKANVPVPPGVFIFEDPPLHGIHRGLLTRVFTPKKMADLEPLIREYCANALDPLVGTGHFDFVANLGAQMPMRVIGMLLGIPEEDQQAVREIADTNLRTEAGKPMDMTDHSFVGEEFDDYIDWRAKHPSDDLMTELLNAEFDDETGTTRRLTRDEVVIFIRILAGAGNETTNRLIGWTGKVLAEHPDQRRQILEDRSLIPQSIEEILRYESPAPHIARYVSRDVELHGQTVPEGSAMVFLTASANRDERKFADADRFDIHRERLPHLTFGHGFHVCLGNALARVEGRVALDEVLNRFPTWELDLDNARLTSTSTVRGWETLPVFTEGTTRRSRPVSEETSGPKAEQAENVKPDASADGQWKLTLTTPMGPQQMTARIETKGTLFTGTIDSAMGSQDIQGSVSGDKLAWTMNVTQPMAITLEFDVTVEGQTLAGTVKLGAFGNARLSGERL